MDLAVLKALADDTRYAMFRELAGTTRALSAQELAERLGVHTNTVRLHLERLREAGLVEVEAVRRGTVGRPQHLYFLSPDAPGLGLDPPAHVVLAGLLGALAERVGATSDDAAEDRKSTRLNSSHQIISYAVFCLKKKKKHRRTFGTRPPFLGFPQRRGHRGFR